MYHPYLLDGPSAAPWWEPLRALDSALHDGDAATAVAAHAAVLRALLSGGEVDLAAAMVSAVVFVEGAWSRSVARAVRQGRSPLAAPGATAAAHADLHALAALLGRAWQRETETLCGRELPTWSDLVEPGTTGDASLDASLGRLRAALLAGDVAQAFDALDATARERGAGPLARHRAFAWDGQQLRGIDLPAASSLASLVGLERQLAPLLANVEAFLAGQPALATLLYGPRGSGKSSAVRGLLDRYGDRGVCLVEVPSAHVAHLADALAVALRQPRAVVLMLDDLAFDDGDERLRPLKSLLEGSLLARRERVLVVATSNRRHLVRERHGDRPDPLDADVHAWDTHHDRLALADRFGLTITFPSTDRRAYLGIVRGLAHAAGLAVDAALEQRALRFAAWGNGHSGRTARQFVDRELADLPEAATEA